MRREVCLVEIATITVIAIMLSFLFKLPLTFINGDVFSMFVSYFIVINIGYFVYNKFIRTIRW